MRTTLDIEEDLLLLAKQLAIQRDTTMGKVISGLVRKALEPSDSTAMRNGVRPFTPLPGAPKPTLELINRLRDEL
jgi:hypothetical protein